MIDVRVTEIGGDAIMKVLDRAPAEIRTRLVAVLNEQGRIAAERARALAPYDPNRKGKSPHLRDSIRYYAWGNNEKSELMVRAVGGLRGAQHAHLIEFGVAPKKIRVYRKIYATKLKWSSGLNRWRYTRPSRVRNRKTFMYTRTHQVRAHPFFEPAIRSLGDVGATLQNALDTAALEMSGEGGAGSWLEGWDK